MFKNHPRGLSLLFFTEMWERFAFYLMLGIFVLYMTDSESGGLAFGTAEANSIYGSFIALVYLTPFLGGLLADRFLGYRKAVIIGGTLMGIGYLGIGLTSGMTFFYLSLGIVIVGNGFFKPNISSIVGRLYPDNSPLKDAGYNIFYMGINIGAFFCNFVAAILRNSLGWGWAFSAAGVGMLAGVIWFIRGQSALDGVSDRGDDSDVEKGELMRLVLQILLPAVTAGVIGYVAAAQFDLASYMSFFTPNNTAFMCAVIPIVGFYLSVLIRAPREEKGPIGALLAIFAVVIIFWMIFHQNGNTLTLWARDHTDRVAGKMAPVLNALALDETAPDSYWENIPVDERPAAGEEVSLVSTELFQSINPLFIILFTPLVVGFFAWLQVRNKEPSTPAKIAWGLLLTAASVLVMVIAVHMTHGGTVRGSAGWLFLTYGIVTLGELCLSPMGLSLVSKLAPARLTALMMGGWFLSTSIGNKLSGVIGGLWELIPLQGIFWINAISALVAAGMIALLVPWIRRVMAEHE